MQWEVEKHLVNGQPVPRVQDKRLIERILGPVDSYFSEEDMRPFLNEKYGVRVPPGSYQRKIAGASHTKTMYGNPYRGDSAAFDRWPAFCDSDLANLEGVDR